jgi:hypothetical protein
MGILLAFNVTAPKSAWQKRARKCPRAEWRAATLDNKSGEVPSQCPVLNSLFSSTTGAARNKFHDESLHWKQFQEAVNG